MEKENTAKSEEIEEPIEYLNDKHLVELDIIEHRTLPEYLKNAGYEKVFRVKTIDQLKEILSDDDLKKDIKKKIKDLGFKKSSCVFIFEGIFEISLELQKKIIDYQTEIFDEITITHIEKQFNDLLHCVEYAKTKNKQISIYSDFKYVLNTIEKTAKLVLEDKEIYKLKLRSRKFKSVQSKYERISSLFKDSYKRLHLTLCNKKISIFGYKNFSFEFIARIYGFKSFCEYFRAIPKIKRKGKPRRFIVLGFNKNTLFYERTWGLAVKRQELKEIAL